MPISLSLLRDCRGTGGQRDIRLVVMSIAHLGVVVSWEWNPAAIRWSAGHSGRSVVVVVVGHFKLTLWAMGCSGERVQRGKNQKSRMTDPRGFYIYVKKGSSAAAMCTGVSRFECGLEVGESVVLEVWYCEGYIKS